MTLNDYFSVVNTDTSYFTSDGYDITNLMSELDDIGCKIFLFDDYDSTFLDKIGVREISCNNDVGFFDLECYIDKKREEFIKLVHSYYKDKIRDMDDSGNLYEDFINLLLNG